MRWYLYRDLADKPSALGRLSKYGFWYYWLNVGPTRRWCRGSTPELECFTHISTVYAHLIGGRDV